MKTFYAMNIDNIYVWKEGWLLLGVVVQWQSAGSLCQGPWVRLPEATVMVQIVTD